MRRFVCVLSFAVVSVVCQSGCVNYGSRFEYPCWLVGSKGQAARQHVWNPTYPPNGSGPALAPPAQTMPNGKPVNLCAPQQCGYPQQ